MKFLADQNEISLGNIHFAKQQLLEAQACYQRLSVPSGKQKVQSLLDKLENEYLCKVQQEAQDENL